MGFYIILHHTRGDSRGDYTCTQNRERRQDGCGVHRLRINFCLYWLRHPNLNISMISSDRNNKSRCWWYPIHLLTSCSAKSEGSLIYIKSTSLKCLQFVQYPNPWKLKRMYTYKYSCVQLSTCSKTEHNLKYVNAILTLLSIYDTTPTWTALD